MEGHSPVGWYGITRRSNGVVRQADRHLRRWRRRAVVRLVPRFFEFWLFFRLTVAFRPGRSADPAAQGVSAGGGFLPGLAGLRPKVIV